MKKSAYVCLSVLLFSFALTAQLTSDWGPYQTTNAVELQYHYYASGNPALPEIVLQFRNSSQRDLTFSYKIWADNANSATEGSQSVEAGNVGNTVVVPASPSTHHHIVNDVLVRF